MPFISQPITSATHFTIGIELLLNNAPKIRPPYITGDPNISLISVCSYPHHFSVHQGTGSYPPLENGLHLKIRQPASKQPFTAPYFSIASSPY